MPATVAIVAIWQRKLVLLHQMPPRIASLDPVSYARWAFMLPVPPTRFTQRLEAHDGKLVEHLISLRRGNYAPQYEEWQAGAAPAAPAISVIVPLYGRADFVEHQLLEFCNDDDFKSGRAELIYVVDDPNLIEAVRASSAELVKLYKIPFRIIWGHVNRGYSGANNLGIAAARGATTVLLNSDVFTKGHGWASEMSQVLLQDDTVCAVGARLEYPDGSIQHLGMKFEYEQPWDVWLNLHPRMGTDVPAAASFTAITVSAVTGACVAMRTADLRELGGLDEGYLIGDFEDSDLCLQLTKTGKKIKLLTHTRHVHLERQSFALFSDSGFRQMITRFNAWRHTRRWDAQIKNIVQEQK